MDPATVVGLVSATVSLAMNCGSAAKDLIGLVSRYQNAKLTILSMSQGLESMQLAWSRIGTWAQGLTPDELASDLTFMQQLGRLLETGNLVMDALKEELLVYSVQEMSFKQRTRMIWNENALQAHQSRVRDQAASMTLLLQAIQLTGPQARQKLLQASEQLFQKSDESAYSIVPSRMSMCTSNLSDDGRLVADEEDLVYRPLSFENDLFTARVYKRNYQWPVIQKVSHFMRRPSSEAMAHKTATRNDSKDSLVGAESIISQGQATVNGEIISVNVGSTEEHAVGQTDINDRESSDSVPSDSEYLMPSMCYIFSGQGDHKTVEHLSEDGHDVHAQNAMFGEPHESMSAMQRNVELSRTLMRDGVDIEHASFPHSIQPIHRAAACGSINIINILLHHGAAIDSIDVDGRQPLHYASQSQCCDRPDVIEFLCSQGADIDANCPKGLVSRPVHFASAQNRVENLKVLLALGAKIDDDHCGSVVSALNIAMRFRAFATASLLLEHGADPNRRDEIGRSAVHALFAEYHGEGLVENPSLYKRIAMLDLLMKHDSELNIQDSKGNTPLHYLVRHRPLSIEESQAQPRLAQKILDCVDSTDTVDHAGLTALYFSLTTPEQEEISLLLIEVGARVLVGKADYQLALHIEQIAASAVLRCSLRHSRGSTTDIWEIGMYSQPQHHMTLPCHKDSADREDFPGAFGKDSIRTIGTILTEALRIIL